MKQTTLRWPVSGLGSMETAAMDKEDKKSTRGDMLGDTAYFIQDETIWKIKIMDMTSKSVGAYCSNEFKPGAQGVISSMLPGSGSRESKPCEVMWCMLDPSAEDSDTPYRVGLRILE